jgi:hypothetical protein
VIFHCRRQIWQFVSDRNSPYRSFLCGLGFKLRKKYGRPEWTRTIDLFRVKEAL